MQDTPEIPKFESQPEKVSIEEKPNIVREKVGAEKEREQLEERSEGQRREDEERIKDIRKELQERASEQENPQIAAQTWQQKIAEEKEKFEQRMTERGVEKSTRFSDEQVEDMGREVIANLDKTFPEYNLSSRLNGAERLTFLAEQTSFNDFAYQRVGMAKWARGIFKHIPFQAAGFSLSGLRTIVNGGLPRFLIKRTMYHEYLHEASAAQTPYPYGSGFSRGINEGATEYYARQAATKEGFAQNIMNPFYLPRALSYALMTRTVGQNVAKEAYFNGRVDEFKEALDEKWGRDAFEKVNDKSSGKFGFGALFYSGFKWLTSR